MLFTHDAQASLRTVAALVNSRLDEDSLTTLADLDAFCAQWEVSGRRDRDGAELAAVRDLRPRLAGLWLAEEEVLVEGVNALLREGDALPQLVRHDGWDWHLHAHRSDAPLAMRLAVEAAMALVDVVRGGERDRLSVCAAEDCEALVVDLSRNRSRKFCEAGCGNRLAAQAYRARRA
ncbi:MAG: CGNR zinc finger domain-containing protein [Nocardioides sp.]|nr:CGNR zinc finger domain-containing protein [Nocardioides sp.]